MQLKVVLVVPTLMKTGVLEVVKNLIIADDNDVNFYLIILKNKYRDQEKQIRKILGKQLIVLPGKVLFSPQKILAFRRTIKDISPDIIHFHSFIADLFSMFLNHKKQLIISTAHNMGEADYTEAFGNFLGTLMAKLQIFLFKRMKCVIGVSKTVAQHYRQLGVKNVTVVRNGTRIDTNVDKVELKNLSLFYPIGIYTGNFESRKNVEFLFDTVSKLNSSKIRTSLIILGSDRNDPNVLEVYKNKYRNSSIFFMGRRENVVPYLKKANYFISPSKSEGLPMAAIEAMGCNLPLILSDIPQHRELKIDNIDEDILFFDPYKMESLRKQLTNFIDNWSTQKKSNNRNVFDKLFTNHKMFEAYKEQYQKLLR